MKILLSHNLEGIGGGSSFARNLLTGMKKYFPDVEFTYDTNTTDYDILFILTPTSIKSFDFIDKAKEMGKKIVFRCDNMPKPHRNRRYRVFQKLKRLIELSDQVIYQSNWAKEHIAWGEIPKKGIVIPNGVDQDIFNRHGDVRDFRDGKDYRRIYLILISSSDPCKRLHENLAMYEGAYRKGIENGLKPIKLIIAGRIPDAYHVAKMEAGWDFVRGEEVEYIGELHSPEEVARTMRGCTHLLFASFNDASPNTILEARACGLDVAYSQTGGTPQMASLSEHKMGLDTMVENYYKCFERVLSNKW